MTVVLVSSLEMLHTPSQVSLLMTHVLSVKLSLTFVLFPGSSENCCSCHAKVPQHSSTPLRTDDSESSNAEVNLVTISSQLEDVSNTLREHSTQLACLSSDTTRIIDNSELYLTASGSHLEPSTSSPSASASQPPPQKRIKIFQDPSPLAQLETPRPYPLHRGFLGQARANLLSSFDRVAKEDAENTAEDSDIVLDDTVIDSVDQPPDSSTAP